MSKVICIIGLPGSGKTYLANTKYVPLNYVLVDDPTDISVIKQLIDENKDIVICDPHLCSEKIRKYAIPIMKSWGAKVECIYFENNEEKCLYNIFYRNDGRKITNLKSFNYTIPDNIIPLEIWTNDK